MTGRPTGGNALPRLPRACMRARALAISAARPVTAAPLRDALAGLARFAPLAGRRAAAARAARALRRKVRAPLRVAVLPLPFAPQNEGRVAVEIEVGVLKRAACGAGGHAVESGGHVVEFVEWRRATPPVARRGAVRGKSGRRELLFGGGCDVPGLMRAGIGVGREGGRVRKRLLAAGTAEGRVVQGLVRGAAVPFLRWAGIERERLPRRCEAALRDVRRRTGVEGSTRRPPPPSEL
jgi:hypothetical protein